MHETIETPVGLVLLAASAGALTHLLYADSHGHPRRGQQPPQGDGSVASGEVLAATRAQLRDFFAGTRRDFDVPLDASGTAFQRQVWAALRDIPFGETVTYGQLATAMGRPAAVRAVGAANGANPISILVPCHRVIGHDGRLTGYAGGLDAKRHLLRLEGGNSQRRRSAAPER